MAMEIVTLKVGDIVEFPEVGKMTVGRITQPYPNRFVVRLDDKNRPSIELNILNR